MLAFRTREIGAWAKPNGMNSVIKWDGLGGIHSYMHELIQHLGSSVSQEIIARERSCCDQFRNEAVTQLGLLKDVQGRVVG